MTAAAVPDGAEPCGVPVPLVVVVDSREQDPWRFRGLTAGADQGRAPLVVPTVVRGLDAGDYSIEGQEAEIRVERKSAGDLFGTLTTGRDRFERELERLAAFPFSCVLIEADFADLVKRPPTLMTPRSFVGSVVAMSQRFPAQWYFAGSRAFAEAVCFQIFERWVNDQVAGVKPVPRKPRRAKAAE